MPDDKDIASLETIPARDTAPSLTLEPLRDTPSIIANRYEVLGLVGAGGMGRVYRAKDRSLDEVVAVKMLRGELAKMPAAVERFRREVKLARRVTSPHVVRTFDLGEHNDELFLTMEYIDGRSLSQLLDDRAPPPLVEVLRIARAACSGIAAAHAAGVLHRDLKPDNIIVSRTGRIAITDFGIAQLAAGDTAEIAGTPAYMAPEQFEHGVVGSAADVFALGAILFEMLAGRRAFSGASLADVRTRPAAPDPRAHRPVSDALAEIVMRCLAPNPNDRYADGAELSRRLEVIDVPVSVPTPQSFHAVVPARLARTLAVLPLRAPLELTDVANGLTEEIVDALSLTRQLRVRPLASVRGHYDVTSDPQQVGKTLGIDVVVDGSLRRTDDGFAIVARAIGIADGFQLWAQRFNARPEQLLTVGDDIARAVAGALTVELGAPAHTSLNAKAIELYLEGKAKLRIGWSSSELAPAIAVLEQALALVPEDARVLAALSQAFARASFFGETDKLKRARVLGESAVALAPQAGESWLALGTAHLYGDAFGDAAVALLRAVQRAPGLSLAHAQLGGILVEIAAFDNAIPHLEAAVALDPSGSFASWDLARARFYTGDQDGAMKVVGDGPRATPMFELFNELQIVRFNAWRGIRHDRNPTLPAVLPPQFHQVVELMMSSLRSGVVDNNDLQGWRTVVKTPNARRRASWSQFAVEVMCFCGEHETAFEFIATAVDAGLQDQAWMDHCPALTPIRPDPRFSAMREVVAGRAAEVAAKLMASR